MLVLSCIFYILWQRQFHLQAQTMTRSQEEAASLLPFVLLGNSCQHQGTAGAAPALLHGHPHSGAWCSLKTSYFPQQIMKWNHMMSQTPSDKLGSTAKGETSTSLLWISIHILPVFSTALWLCLCTGTCIFRNLVYARSAKPSDCEDVCTVFCRVTCSELNEDNIVGAMPVEIQGTSRNAMSQSQCLETRDKQKAKWLLLK